MLREYVREILCCYRVDQKEKKISNNITDNIQRRQV